MRFSVNHPYPRHIVVSFKNPITRTWLEDLHIYFDGRMSFRTAREHFVEEVREYTRKLGKPAQAQYWYALGVNDNRKHPIPFVPANDFNWRYNDDVFIHAYRPYDNSLRESTYLVFRDGRQYELRYSRVDDHTVALSAFTVPVSLDAPERAAYQEAQTYDVALHHLINTLTQLERKAS